MSWRWRVRSPSRGLFAVALVAAGIATSALTAAAQEPAEERSEAGGAAARVESARRLAGAGSFDAAIDTLRSYLAEFPGDGGTRWLLARYLHQAGRPQDAAREYEESLIRLPDDPWLRLEYARLLLDMGESEHVAGVLERVLSADSPPAARAPALTLAGTAAYWQGDLTTATRRFREALAADPAQADARRQLDEIRSLTRPWVSVGAAVLDDNQPYRRYRATVEGGAYLSPSWSLAGAVVPRLLDVPPEAGSVDGAQTGTAAAWLELAGRIPSQGLGLRARLGGWWTGGLDDVSSLPGRGHRPGGPGPESGGAATWLGAAELSLELPFGVTFRAGASRDRYLATSTATDTLLMVRTLDARLDRAAAPGWAGEVVARVQLFPDDNAVSTGYAWLLVPLMPWLRAGWAASWQDSRESRWVTGDLEDARYVPYYTPERIAVQSVLGEVFLGTGVVEVRASGRYGVAAREQAPAILVEDPAGVDVLAVANFEEREFTPWEARLEVAAEPAGLPAIRFVASREATAFWTQSRLELAATYRFPLRPLP